jgi:hypothetical protein
MKNRVRLVQCVWIVLVVLAVVRLVAAARIYLLEVRIPCSHASCQVGPPQMTLHEIHLLQGMGISFDLYALYFAAISVVYVAINCAFAAVLLWKRPTDRMAVLTAYVLTLFSAFGLSLPAQLFHQWAPVLWIPAAILGFLGSTGMPVVFYLFPDGRPVPRWPALLVAVYAVTQLQSYIAPTSSVGGVMGAVFGIAIIAMYLSLIYAQIYRYRRVSTPIQREQTKWVVYGIGATILGWIGMLFFYNYAYSGTNTASPTVDMVSMAAGTFVWLLLPVSLAVAILRYRLWEIDTLINRTLVYGSLTVSLAALYIGSVIGLQALSRAVTGQHSDLAIAIATLVVAAVFNPWRRRLRDFIDRRFYRRKYDAARVLEAFTSQLRDEVDLDQLAGNLAGVVGETVQPSSISLWLRSGEQSA